MAPLFGGAGLFVGSAPALAAYFGSSLVWEAAGAGGLPEIGAEFEGGYFAGVISHTADDVATHALVVAPRSTGATGAGYTLTATYAAKTTNTATANTGSLFNGAANTAAMIAAGASQHPAAQWCDGLTIGGLTDWYLPANAELNIAYFNLKPTTAANTTSSGSNSYSVPKRTANFSASVPGRTALSLFQLGGAQCFQDSNHRSSTQTPGNTSFNDYLSFQTGNTTLASKTLALAVRAFRNVPL